MQRTNAPDQSNPLYFQPALMAVKPTRGKTSSRQHQQQPKPASPPNNLPAFFQQQPTETSTLPAFFQASNTPSTTPLFHVPPPLPQQQHRTTTTTTTTAELVSPLRPTPPTSSNISDLSDFFKIRSHDGSAGYGNLVPSTSQHTHAHHHDNNEETQDDNAIPLHYDTVDANMQGLWRKLWGGMPLEYIKRIQMDGISTFSVTSMSQADTISQRLSRLPGISSTSIITDATACVGGNAISFARFFSRVNAIETNLSRCQMLHHNTEVCRSVQVSSSSVAAAPVTGAVYVYHGDCMSMVPRLKQDLVFLDPPWGGKDYRAHDHVSLYLNSLPLHIIVLGMLKHAKYVAIKVPLNAEMAMLNATHAIRMMDRIDLPKFVVVVYQHTITTQRTPTTIAPHDTPMEKVLLSLVRTAPFVDLLCKTSASVGSAGLNNEI